MARTRAQFCDAVPVATASSTVRPENGGRRVLDLVNDGANVVYLQLQTSDSAPTAVVGKGIRLNPNGGSWSAPMGPNGSCVYTGAIAAIASVGASSLTVAEV